MEIIVGLLILIMMIYDGVTTGFCMIYKIHKKETYAEAEFMKDMIHVGIIFTILLTGIISLLVFIAFNQR